MIRKGQDLMVFIGGRSIAYATNHSLNVTMETKETTTKDSGGKWTTAEGGIMSWTANSENMVTDDQGGYTYAELFDLMVQRKPVDLIFGLENENAGKYNEKEKWDAANNTNKYWTPNVTDRHYKGKAFITSLSQNAPNNDNATFTVEFTGVGALENLGKAPVAPAKVSAAKA